MKKYEEIAPDVWKAEMLLEKSTDYDKWRKQVGVVSIVQQLLSEELLPALKGHFNVNNPSGAQMINAIMTLVGVYLCNDLYVNRNKGNDLYSQGKEYFNLRSEFYLKHASECIIPYNG